MSSEYNPAVDHDFATLAKAKPGGPPLFISGYPEHQWEGKYRLQEGDTFVEAGAFWGRYGLIASHRVGPEGRVILVEGNPDNCEMIKKVIAHYEINNIELVEGIIWSKTEKALFCTYGNPAGSRKAIESDRTNYPDDVIEVQAFALDDLLSSMKVDFVDLLACDVEGAEVELVKGMRMYLDQKRIRNVAIGAYHDATLADSREIMMILKTHGYKDVFYSGTKPQFGFIVFGHVRRM